MRLEVDIKKKAGDFELAVSFACDNNVTAILGESGCGKSMTLKCIAGIETPDDGRIVLDGRVLFDSKEKINLPPQQRKIGYMFQDYALFPNMTVRENIEIAQNGQPVEDSVLERFNIADISDLYPAQLSGGQKQRTAMARMLAANPDVVLLDEPFSALDSHLRWKMEQEVKQILQAERKPVIFVSHDRDEVYRLSEYAGVMLNGKMTDTVNTRELFENPGNREAAAITGCKNISKAIKTDDNKVNAADWGIELITGSRVSAQESYIGIRAHSFSMNEIENGNCIKVLEPQISEEPFEWTITFRADKDADWLQWKVSKDLVVNPKEGLPDRLWISPEKIMVLDKSLISC